MSCFTYFSNLYGSFRRGYSAFVKTNLYCRDTGIFTTIETGRCCFSSSHSDQIFTTHSWIYCVPCRLHSRRAPPLGWRNIIIACQEVDRWHTVEFAFQAPKYLQFSDDCQIWTSNDWYLFEAFFIPCDKELGIHICLNMSAKKARNLRD